MRRLTNIEQITQYLQRQADEQQFSIIDICEHLDNMKDQHVEIEEGIGLHRLESEKSKVKIMTIHSAKGLEFPVVFLIGGITAGNVTPGFVKVHDKNSKTVIYDFGGTSKAQHDQERLDEEKRLFYVALTRAVYKLYVPIYLPDDKRNLSNSGPVTHLIS